MENNTSGNGLEEFLNISVSAHDNFALRKKKYSRGNSAFFMKNYCLSSSRLKKKTVVNKTAYITEYTAHVYRITVFLFYKRQRETTTPI